MLLAIEQARIGDAVQAGAALDEALGLSQDSDAAERRAVLQASASHVAMFAGDHATALARMEHACELARLADASSALDYAMSHLSGLALGNGDIEAARRHAARAVKRARDRHTPVFLVTGLVWAMEAALAAGDVNAARRLVAEAIEQARESGVLTTFAGTFATLAFRIGEVATGCRLLGWTNAQDPVEPNAAGRARAEERRALKVAAEAKLGATAVQRLLALGASMSQAELVELAATLQASVEPTAPG